MLEISNLYSSEEYKNRVINLLYRNDNFISLINPTPSECPDLDIIDVLNGGEWIIDGKKWKEQGHVFDYNFVDETIVEEKTFVMVDTDISRIRNNIFTDFNLYIFIFTAKSLVRLNNTSIPTAKQVKDMGYFASTTHGNRIGALCECIDGILNGSNNFKSLGTVKPDPQNHMSFYSPKSEYYGKCLKYNISNYNSGGDNCGN